VTLPVAEASSASDLLVLGAPTPTRPNKPLLQPVPHTEKLAQIIRVVKRDQPKQKAEQPSQKRARSASPETAENNTVNVKKPVLSSLVEYDDDDSD